MTTPSLAIDEEGYIVLPQEIRLTDALEGAQILKQITMGENGSCWSVWDDQKILLEPFNKPYVALQVIFANNEWCIQLPYGLQQKFSLNTLCVDSWDRFHGLCENKVPFVLSRAAQAEFFNLLDEFDDDSITFQGQNYPVPPFYITNRDAQEENFWTAKYAQNTPVPWDLKSAHPALDSVLPQLKLNKCRVLNLGCGIGHDAAYFAQKGHLATGVDLSPLAIEKAKSLYTNTPHLQLIEADIFSPKNDWEADLIFEHTLFCAIDPSLRKNLVQKWHQFLAPQGHLLGIFFVNPHRGGPPFGGSEWELRTLLEKQFRLLYWKRWPLSPPHRHGTEIVIYAQKK